MMSQNSECSTDELQLQLSQTRIRLSETERQLDALLELVKSALLGNEKSLIQLGEIVGLNRGGTPKQNVQELRIIDHEGPAPSASPRSLEADGQKDTRYDWRDKSDFLTSEMIKDDALRSKLKQPFRQRPSLSQRRIRATTATSKSVHPRVKIGELVGEPPSTVNVASTDSPYEVAKTRYFHARGDPVRPDTDLFNLGAGVDDESSATWSASTSTTAIAPFANRGHHHSHILSSISFHRGNGDQRLTQRRAASASTLRDRGASRRETQFISIGRPTQSGSDAASMKQIPVADAQTEKLQNELGLDLSRLAGENGQRSGAPANSPHKTDSEREQLLTSKRPVTVGGFSTAARKSSLSSKKVGRKMPKSVTFHNITSDLANVNNLTADFKDNLQQFQHKLGLPSAGHIAMS